MSEKNVEQLPSLEKAGEVLAKRVQGAFVDLITEEQMKGLVQKAIEKYTSPRKDAYGRETSDKQSQLEVDISKEVTDIMRPQIKTLVNNALGDVAWNPDKLKEFVIAVAPQVMNTVFQNLVSTTIQNIQRTTY